MNRYKVWVKLEEEYDDIEADSEEEAFKIASDYAMSGGSWQKLIELVAESEPQESDIEKHKPCINYSDGCEEWDGCPCVYYNAESEVEVI